MTGELERRPAIRVAHQTDRQLTRADREIEQAQHRLRVQIAKERAAVTSIRSCAEAAAAVPDSAPPGLRTMTERIARGTSRLIGRML